MVWSYSADDVMGALQKIVPKLAEEACAIAQRLARISPLSPEQLARAAANKEAALRKLAEKRAARESTAAFANPRLSSE